MSEQKSVLKILVSLLRSEVLENPAHDLKEEDFTPEKIEQLYKYSKAHDLAHIVGKGLESLGFIDKSSAYLEKFRKQQLLAFYRYERMNYEAEQIYSVLETHKIPFIALKGAVIRSLYPEEYLRTSCDIDVLVHEKDLKKAVKALEGDLKYKTQGSRNYHDISLFSEGGIHLELHFNILENMSNIDTLLSKVWDHASPYEDSEYRYRLSDTFLAFHTLAHMSYHFVSGGCGIRPFLDYQLIKSKLDIETDELRRMCEDCKIEKFLDATDKLCRVWFENEASDELCESMQRFILSGGVYGTLDNKVSVQNVRKGSSFRYLMSRVFGSYGMMKIRYPILQRHKWLLPFCQIHRWFSGASKGGLGRSLNEAKKSSRSSTKELGETEKLLNKLGLNEQIST